MLKVRDGNGKLRFALLSLACRISGMHARALILETLCIICQDRLPSYWVRQLGQLSCSVLDPLFIIESLVQAAQVEALTLGPWPGLPWRLYL